MVPQSIDGRKSNGDWYINVSHLLPIDDDLEPDAQLIDFSLEFANPDHVQFLYELEFYAYQNLAPHFVTDPLMEAVPGHEYRYDSDAVDPESDTLTYDLVYGPAGMNVDNNTGEVTWTPSASQMGIHTVRINVTDPYGGRDRQQYTIDVHTSAINRPPHFVTSPILEAYVGVQYLYDSDAFDPDYDSLTYSVVSGPSGLVILDPTAGVVTWTPSPNQLGMYVDVTLRVGDNHATQPGVDFQSYRIFVHPQPGNLPPVITTEPRIEYDLVGESHPASDNVSPTAIDLVLGPGVKVTRTVSIDFTTPKIDLTLLYDSSGSVEGLNNGSVLYDLRNRLGELASMGIDLGFGFSRLLDFKDSFATPPSGNTHPPVYDDPTDPVPDPDRPFILQQPILPVSSAAFIAAIQAAIDHRPAGDGGSLNAAESVIQALFHVATGLGFDFDANGVFGNGPAGQYSVQWGSDYTGDVPPFATFFPPDTSNPPTGWAPAGPGNIGGVGFREGAIPVVLVLTDHGSRYRLNEPVDANGNIIGVDGVQIPLTTVTNYGANTAPTGAAYIQSTVDYLKEIGAFVVGLGMGLKNLAYEETQDPDGQFYHVSYNSLARTFLESLSTLTGTLNRSNTPILSDNSLIDGYIQPGEPLYYEFGYWGDNPNTPQFDAQKLALTDVIKSSIDAVLNSTLFDVEVVATDTTTGLVHILTGPLQFTDGTLSFNVEFTGDGKVHNFDLQFRRVGTGLVLGHLPVTINYGYQYDVDAMDPDGDAVSLELLESPAGVTFDTTTGLLRWQPTTPGHYAFAVRANDGKGGEDIQRWTVVVNDPVANNTPPVISTTGPIYGKTGRAIELQIAASDIDGGALRYYLLDSLSHPVPPGMDIDGDSGLITWTPNPSQFGTYTVDILVADEQGGSAAVTINFVISVDLANQNTAPTVSGFPFTEAVTGDRYHYQVIATDAQNDVLRFELVVGPEGMVVDPQTGVLAWNPITSHLGYHPIYLKVYDSKGLNANQQFRLHVRRPNEAPVFVSDPAYDVTPVGTILTGTPWRYDPVATDSDGDVVTYRIDSYASSLGITINQNNQIEWTPGVTQVGDHVITVTAEDQRGGVSSQRIPIYVRGNFTGINRPPVITSGPPAAYGVVHQLFTYDVTATDPEGGMVYVILDGNAAAQGMSIERTSTGWRVHWEPTATGRYRIVLTAIDQPTATSRKTFDISVLDQPISSQTNDNGPQFISEPNGPAVRDLPYVYQAVGFDDDGDSLSYSLMPIDVPSSFSASIDSQTGRFLWTPDKAGDFQFKITASDGVHSAYQIVSLVVLANAPPRITSAPIITVNGNQSYNYVVTVVDPNVGDALTFAFFESPSGMSFDAATHSIVWASPAIGTHAVTLRVSDGNGGESTQTFDLRVFDPAGSGVGNTAPTIVSGFPTSWLADRTLAHQVVATDPNRDPLTYQLVGAPAGMTIDNRGLVRWTPTTSQVSANPYTFTVQVSDDRGGVDQATYSIRVTTQSNNYPPIFNSTPSIYATAGATYSYDADAIDFNDDTFTFSIFSGPAGMTIDPLTGLIQWTPGAAEIGIHSVRLRVADPYGAATLQIFALVVAHNSPPMIESSPIESGLSGAPYIYDVIASDPDGQALTYGGLHLYAPSGIEIVNSNIHFDGSTLRWTAGAVGIYRISFVVSDTLGGFDTQEYFVSITAPPTSGGANQNPTFTSTPQLWASAGLVYSYTPTGTDPDGQPVTFSLVHETSSATVSFANGVLTWTPPASEVNALIYFGVKISDNANPAGYQTQWFSVRVFPANTPPVVDPIADQLVTIDDDLMVDVVAWDNDGNEITFALDSASLARGITIDEQGRIRWSPDDPAAFSVTVTVSDTFGGSTSRTFAVNVVLDTIAPVVDLGFSPSTPYSGNDLIILVMASDNVGIAERTLKLLSVTRPDNSVVTYNQWLFLDEQGRAHLQLGAEHIGQLNFEATATDVNGLITTFTKSQSVFDPNVSSQPTVAIHSPYLNQKIEDVLSVIATIDDRVAGVDQITSWVFEVFSRLTGEVVFETSGTNEVFNAFLTKFDPTQLPNGLYNLSLTATNTGGHSASASVLITVEGTLKPGEFVVGFTDLEVPVRGFPISITRTYDSKSSSSSGDFGFGWRMDIDTTKLQTVLGKDSQSGLYGFPTFTDGTRVVVTLPDGSVAGFTFVGVSAGGFSNFYTPKFFADAGVRHKLIVDEIYLYKTAHGYVGVQEEHDYNPADPAFGNSYELRLRNGNKFLITADEGLTSQIIDRDGNTLTFTGQGIVSSAGRGVTFERDFANRIIAIVDPDGKRITYRYDSAGNLIGVKDRAGQVTGYETTFTYRTDGGVPSHYLDTILDPLGRQPVRTEYYSSSDVSGSGEFGLGNRIKRITDAAGKVMDFQYELSTSGGSGGIVLGQDRLRSRTTLEYLDDAHTVAIRSFEQYDGTGNVIGEMRGKYILVSGAWQPVAAEPPSTMLHTFDSKSNLTSETMVVGLLDSVSNGELNDLTSRYLYTEMGDMFSAIDPRGNATYNSFDEDGKLWSSADIFGVGTGNFYTTDGRLTRTFTATSEANFFYNPATGDLQTIEDEFGQNLITTGYNKFGDVTSTIDANRNGTTIEYDLDGNQVATVQGATADLDGDGTNEFYEIRNETSYDDSGRVIGTTRKRYLVVGTVKTLLSEETSGSNDKNALGQDNTTLDSTGLKTGYTYDIRGQAIETRRQTTEQNSSGTVWLVSRTVYDSNGRALVSSDEYRVAINTSGVRTQLTPLSEITGSRSSFDGHDRVVFSERIRGFEITFTGLANLQTSQFSAGPTFDVLSTSQSKYDNAGRVIESTDQYGLKTFYLFNRFGEALQTRHQARDQNGTIVELSSETVYDQLGRVILSTDSHLAGAIVFGTMTLYDQLNRAHRTLRLKGVSVDLSSGNSVITSEGETLYATQSSYDSKGRVAESIDAQGNVTSYQYDGLGRRIATLGPVVNIGGTQYRHRTETVYDNRGRVASETSGISVNVATSATSYADAKRTEFSYDDRGNVIRTILRSVIDGVIAYVMYAQFDTRGRKVAESQPTSFATGVIYSATDESFKSGATLIPTRTFEYNDQGQLVAVELPAVLNPATPDPNDVSRPRYEYGYDGRGNQTLVRDPLGHETRWTFNEQGQEINRTLPLGFGSDGILASGETPNGTFAESFQYDSQGRQSVHISFEGVYTQNIYDPLTGRLSAMRLFQNAAIYNDGLGTPTLVWSYIHDAFGRMISQVLTAGATTLRTETTTYNDEGLVDTMTGPEGSVHYEYDLFGRKIRVSAGSAGFQPASSSDYENITEYSYDSLGRLATVTATERNNVLVDIDAVVSGAQPDVTNYIYDIRGNLDAVLYSNSIVHDYTFDKFDRLTLLRHFKDIIADGYYDPGVDSLLAKFDYSMQPNGKRVSATERFFDSSGAQTQLNNFYWTYDSAGRLVAETLDSSDNSLDYVDSFAFDLTGNRLSTSRNWGDAAKDDYSVAYTFDANDRLLNENKDFSGSTADEFIAYGYNATQQSSKTSSSAFFAFSVVHYSYDLFGRMTLVRQETLNASGQVTAVEETSTEYDSTGTRVASIQRVDSTNDGTFETATRTEYLVDPSNPTGYSQVIMETQFDANGNPLKRIVYTIGHDQISQTVYGPGSGGQTWDAGTTHYFGTDGHGSVRVLFNALAAIVTSAANVQQIFHFNAYGNILNMPAASALTSYLYSSESFDANTQLQYLRSRFYDPRTGRMPSRDPIRGHNFDPQSFHKYAYVHGDPINGIDPSGESLLGSFVGFVGNIAFQVSVISLVYGPTITLAAMGATILSMFWLIAEDLQFVPDTNIPELLFAVSTVIWTLGLSMYTFGSQMRNRMEPFRGTQRGGQVISGKEANSRVINGSNRPGYTQPASPHYANSPPYQKNSLAAEGVINPQTRLVQVLSLKAGDPTPVTGRWVTTYNEIRGLTRQQIQQKLALDRPPTHIGDAKIRPGTWGRSGIAGEQSQSQVEGGGLQIEIPDRSFRLENIREIPVNGLQ